MSTSDTTHPPSFEELREAQQHIRHSPATKRLFWSLDGPLSTSIKIMENFSNPDSLEPYFRQTTGGTSWHPISESPLTDPKMSSVTVHVYEFDWWEEDWLDIHADHVDLDARVHYSGDDFEIGPLPNYDPEVDEEGPEHLLMCCGTKRPCGKAHTLVVKPTVSGNNFITVHDYLSAVHPWLMNLREDILWAKGLADDAPLPANTKLLVDLLLPSSLRITEAAEWIDRTRKEAAGQVIETHIYAR